MIFEDRAEAGRQLAAALTEYRDRANVIVLALPRGGVPVAFEVAQSLRAPLDAFVVRKLGTPGQEELAMGAVASGGAMVLNDEVVNTLRIPRDTVEAVFTREAKEVESREHRFRGDRAPLDVSGKTVILVDDGLATGSTMRVAIKVLRAEAPAKIVVAVPVAAAATCERVRALADELICLFIPVQFYAVGEWYRDFSQTSDEDVRALLDRAAAGQRGVA